MKHEVVLNAGGGLAEIYQSINMKFAFCSVDKNKETNKMLIKQLHPWIKCRDFLGDALFATHHRCSYSIYGFNWNGEEQRVPTNLTYMLIKHGNKEQLKNNLKVLHHFESKVRWKKTKLIDLDKNSGGHVFLVIASKRWVSSTVLISLYTMLWRLAGVGIKEEESVDDFIKRCSQTEGNDGRYLKKISEIQNSVGLKEHLFYTIMRHNRTIFADGYKYNGASDIPGRVHNYNGILTISQMTQEIIKSDREPTNQFGDHYSSMLANIIKKKTKKAI